MKNLVYIVFLCSILFSQNLDDLLSYPIEELESSVVFESEKKPNWNIDLERFEYSSVISEGLDNLKKDELYYRLVRWATLSFPSVKNVVELQDKTSGNIIIKASISNSNNTKTEFDVSRRKKKISHQTSKFTFPFLLDIKIKDGRYKYDLFISRFSLEVLLQDENLDYPVSSGTDAIYHPITNMNHNYLNSTKNSVFIPKNMYELVDEKAQELILNMKLYVLNESLEEDW